MKTGKTFECPNCGVNSRIESIEIGRKGDEVVNLLRCEQCKQICEDPHLFDKADKSAAAHLHENAKTANAGHGHTKEKKGGHT